MKKIIYSLLFFFVHISSFASKADSFDTTTLSPQTEFRYEEVSIDGLFFDFSRDPSDNYEFAQFGEYNYDFAQHGSYITVRQLLSATIYIGYTQTEIKKEHRQRKIRGLMHDFLIPAKQREKKEKIPLLTWYIHENDDGTLLIHVYNSNHRSMAVFNLIQLALHGSESDLKINLDTKIPAINLMSINADHPKAIKFYKAPYLDDVFLYTDLKEFAQRTGILEDISTEKATDQESGVRISA